MNQVDYSAMSDQELKQHFLKHREDKVALQTYLRRLGERSHEVITTVDDPEFDTKIQAAILKQLQESGDKSESAG